MFFLDPISRASLSTCLTWINTPVQPLLWSCVEYYPPGISRLSWNCITSYEFFIKCYLSTDSNFLRALSYYTLKDTDNWIEFALRFNKYLNPSLLTNLLILQVIPSLIGYIIIELILTVLPGPSSRSTIFDDELTLRRSSSSYHFALNNKLGYEFVSYPWFQ